MSVETAEGIAQRERSNKILECAVRIFPREGFASTDVQQIADAAGVGKGTIYRHYGNKEQLFLAAARYVRQQMLDEAEAHANRGATPLDRLRNGVSAVINYFHRQPEVVEMLIQERANFRDKTPTFFDDADCRNEYWVALIEQLIAQGIVRDLPVPQIQAALSRFIFGAMFVSYLGGACSSKQADEGLMLDMLSYGFLKQHAASAQTS
ncbi:MAG TPA: TetR/AcrR family transcriptional regulator [Pirellulaceae bacterium]|nr:TetR/AcrR family transcriptional regulator [Pirellulaceae bacterium]